VDRSRRASGSVSGPTGSVPPPTGSVPPLAGSVSGLAGAVLGPRTAALRAPHWSDRTRLLGGGLLFGFAAAVKIWALLPLAIAELLVLATARRLRPAATLAAGAAVGGGVPLLPFALLAPAALARGVLIGQLVRNANGPRQRLERVADLAGLGLHPFWRHELSLVALIVAALVGCCAAAYLPAVRPLARRPPDEVNARALDGHTLDDADSTTAGSTTPDSMTARSTTARSMTADSMTARSTAVPWAVMRRPARPPLTE
jgi:hypothetical protein